MSAVEELRQFANCECFCATMTEPVRNGEVCATCMMLSIAERAIAEVQQPLLFDRDKAMADARASYLACQHVEQPEPIHWPTKEGRAAWDAVVSAVMACLLPRAQQAPRGPWCIGGGCNKTAIWCEDHGEEKVAPDVTREEAITVMLEKPPGTIQDCDFGRQMRERTEAGEMLARLEALGLLRWPE